MQRELPVWELHDGLRAAWRAGNRLVLVAPTGSGKSTQVPQMLLNDGRVPADQRIVVLQPRRVAARSVARRVADEMGVPVGGAVGYQVRFDDALGPATRIAYVTEGMLLRWLQDDPRLSRVGALLFDEFHERSLLGDVALAVARQLQEESRPGLLIGVMSATLEARPVAGYLGGCPILEAAGRAFPVEVRHEEWSDDDAAVERAAARVAELLRETDEGDILVFMPGAYEIARTMEEIRLACRANRAGWEPALQPIILPLHGELSPREQDRAFLPSAQRRVIVSTNVAETSVTLPGVRHVVDSGLARVARFDPARGVDTLRVEPISQASADQRAGRAGRVAPGVCWRLWSAADHAARPARNTPEIQRADLAEAVLLLHALGRAGLPFLDPPDPERARRAEALLEMLGAIESRSCGFARPGHEPLEPEPAGSERAEPVIAPPDPDPAGLGSAGAKPAQAHPQGLFHITPLGRDMLRLPVHPRYARMLIEARRRGCQRQAALLAALVGGRSLFTRLDRNDRITRRNRERFYTSRASDFPVLAAAFDFAQRNGFDARTCYSHGVNPHAAREVGLACQQLLGLCEPDPASPGAAEGGEEAIARCHLAGFVDQLAARRGSGTDAFDLADGRQATLMDESAVRQATLVAASELREITTRAGERLTLLGVASAVKPEWVRELNPPGLSESVEHVYDRLSKRVAAGRVLRYRDLVIGGAPVDAVDPDQAARVLATEFADQVARLPRWDHALRQWLLRARLAGALEPGLGLPAVDRALVEAGLARAWRGAASYKEAAGLPLLPAFQALLTEEQRAAVEALAPAEIELAPGRAARVVYAEGRPPEVTVGADLAASLAAGSAAPPAIAGGRVPLRLRHNA
jgi:ATP-dependent helicase HrpB